MVLTRSAQEQLAAEGRVLRYPHDFAFWALADRLHTALIVEAGEPDLWFEMGEAPDFYSRSL
jgi:hypothetical protein